MYRIKYKIFRGYEPQHYYNAGSIVGMFWYPLNEFGYWLEPEAYNYGKITKHKYFSHDEAKRILIKAMSINQQNIS